MKEKRSSFRFSLRTKLLILSLAFLLVPYTAYRSLLELENNLRKRLEDSLMEVGNSLSAFLTTREDLLRHDISNDDNFLFVHDLKYPVLLDGYGDEWGDLLPWANRYQLNKAFSYRVMFGRYENKLYILIDVKDENLDYHDPTKNDNLNYDHVSLIFDDSTNKTRTLELAPEAPGKFFPFRQEAYWQYEQDIGLVDPEYRKIYLTNIQAYWQTTKEGYSIELELPWHLVPARLGITVHNATQNLYEPESLSTFDLYNNESIDLLIQQSKELKQIIKSLGISKKRRIWVLDTLGQVIAVDGSLKSIHEKTSVNFIYDVILPKTYVRFTDELSDASRLQGKEIINALNGAQDLRWRASEDDKVVILSTATPIKYNNLVKGVVVVEETTNSIQLLKRDALTNLFNKTIVVFSVITILILAFASYLSIRLRNLANQSNKAIDEHGRVVGEITIKQSNDELGDLVSNFKQVLSRLKQYHDYLEGMAGKLSHEIRTPLTVVQSSLENMEHVSDKQKTDEYMQRAKEGIRQLNLIISRLSEASRLENSFEQTEMKLINIDELIRNTVTGYQDAYKNIHIEYKSNIQPINIFIAPDLIVQLMDKLVQNAVDFHEPGTAIDVTLDEDSESILLQVSNLGPTIPEELQSQLFQSMASHRGQGNTKQVHLGLGLYIVRLIAEFHQGIVNVGNLDKNNGVRVTVRLPKNSKQTSV